MVNQDVLKNPLLYLSYYFKLNRSQYYKFLTKVRTEGDFEGWIEFFLKGVIVTSQLAIASIQAIVNLKEQDILSIASSKLSNTTQALQVLDYLYKQPFMTSNNSIDLLHVSKPSAGKIINEFIRLDILKLDSEKIRYLQYRYNRYVSLLQQGTEL